MLIHLSKPVSMYGSFCKFGSVMLDSASTLVAILDSGQNHMADTMALYLQRASYDVVILLPLIVGVCRYFLQQNEAIRSGTVQGQIINLKTLGIGNGLTVRR
jgi:uncharacterized membrane protein YfhO